MPRVPLDWLAAAISITPSFETSGDPYAGVIGDFDGMGISCGALQWNIGKGSLQPMVLALTKTVVSNAMPIYGDQMRQACLGSIANGLKIVRSWQTGTILKKAAKSEIRNLMITPEMRRQQQIRIDALAETAFQRAEEWAADRDRSDATKRLFCWFFDITTQNGSLKGLRPKDVINFISLNSPDKADDLICNFLKDRKGPSGHVKDANKNGALWLNQASSEKLELLCMSYLRSETANPKWQHIVLNRKGTIAMGKGWVNSSFRDFSAHGL